MSTTFDDGTFGAGPSTLRAFLHALARKLARLGHACTTGTRKALGILRTVSRTVVDTTASTVTTVFRRSGVEAAVGLLLAGGQIIGYAARSAVAAAGALVNKVAGSAGRRIRIVVASPDVRQAATRTAQVVRQPWVAAVVIGIAVLATVIVGWFGLRNRVAVSDTSAWNGITRVTTVANRSWSVTPEDLTQVMTRLFVVLGQDGSVRVHGIPDGWPKHIRADIATVAAEAAEQRLESLVARGRPLTPLDLQAVNVAARAAVSRHFTPGEAA
jgi:hypothetical protein